MDQAVAENEVNVSHCEQPFWHCVDDKIAGLSYSNDKRFISLDSKLLSGIIFKRYKVLDRILTSNLFVLGSSHREAKSFILSYCRSVIEEYFVIDWRPFVVIIEEFNDKRTTVYKSVYLYQLVDAPELVQLGFAQEVRGILKRVWFVDLELNRRARVNERQHKRDVI